VFREDVVFCVEWEFLGFDENCLDLGLRKIFGVLD
jgi:hypothetical protein